MLNKHCDILLLVDPNYTDDFQTVIEVNDPKNRRNCSGRAPGLEFHNSRLHHVVVKGCSGAGRNHPGHSSASSAVTHAMGFSWNCAMLSGESCPILSICAACLDRASAECTALTSCHRHVPSNLTHLLKQWIQNLSGWCSAENFLADRKIKILLNRVNPSGWRPV